MKWKEMKDQRRDTVNKEGREMKGKEDREMWERRDGENQKRKKKVEEEGAMFQRQRHQCVSKWYSSQLN